MKLFPQLALVSAIAISGNAMAMQALDDTALSAATGQEGITLTITPANGLITIDQLVVNDADGLNDTALGLDGDAGAITLGRTTGAAAGSDLEIETTGIDVVIDADGDAGVPVLNVNITLKDTVIKTGDIGVSVGGTTALRQDTTVTIIDSLTIDLGTTSLNVQLGNEAQGEMIKIDATITDGLKISGLALQDKGGTIKGGAISVGEILITDAEESFLTVDASIDVSATGLVLTNNGGAVDVVLDNVKLGSNAVGNTTPTLGDVGLFGLNMTGTTITISGH